MPHKRNPDLFELTRGRAAALEGDLVALLQIKGKLAGGYQRDFQLLKEPLMRGLDRAEAMLAVVAHAVPRLGVDRARCAAALEGGALATDEVMRRVEAGRAVPDRLPRGRGGARGGRAVSRAIASPAPRPARVHRRPRQPRPGPRARPRPARRAPGSCASGAASTAPCPASPAAAARRPARPSSRPPGNDRRPPEAPPQDPRAHQHPRRADPGRARGGARGGRLGGDPVIGQPGHRGAPPDQGGRRLPAAELGARPGGSRTSAASPTGC